MSDAAIIRLNTAVFEALETAVNERHDLSFWGAGRAIRRPEVKERDPRYGSWYANTLIGDRGERFGLACSIQPGEVRIGVTLLRSRSLTENEMRIISPDGKLPDITRDMDAMTLFDWIYRDGPFSPQWFFMAYQEDDNRRTDADAYAATATATATAMIAAATASRLVNTWKGMAMLMARRYKIFTNEYTIVSMTEIDMARLMGMIDGHIVHNGFDERIGHIVSIRTNDSFEATEAAVASLSEDAVLTKSE